VATTDAGADANGPFISGWRLVKQRFAHVAFDGEGARRYGGRWNSPGRPMVYLGGAPAIAALEVMAHNARASLLRQHFVIIEARIPVELVLDLDPAALRGNWNDPADTDRTAAIGDAWLRSRSSVALRVPSAVLPLERNLLLNPLHGAFGAVRILEPRPFAFDPRLAES